MLNLMLKTLQKTTWAFDGKYVHFSFKRLDLFIIQTILFVELNIYFENVFLSHSFASLRCLNDGMSTF